MARRRSDIERYLRGEMTPSEMHALEREALNDPFLSEALEGATQAGADSFLFDVKELRASFKLRARPRKVKIISMWNWSLGIAAGLVFMAVTSIYIISSIDQRPKHDIRIIRGKVISFEGSPLAGVNVLVNGTNQGTVTDTKGNYSIGVADESKSLMFIYPGLGVGEVKAQSSETGVMLYADPEQQSKVMVAGQASPDDPYRIFQFAEPQGGRDAFEKYLVSQKRYPKPAAENKTTGEVTVQFTVSDKGELSDFKILKGIGDGCDDEVIRLVKEGPRWTPSQLEGKPVSDTIKVFLHFDHQK